ncbi:hypothetical protein ABZ707_27515 [Streptomyces sp. NPDC006923]|uniref:hypothetical protein n=1 Tax=Streptomyces sp. NPDC006923 TaxID=3155355 RepID=UPI0033F937CD
MNTDFSRRTLLRGFTGVAAGATLFATGEGLLAPGTAQAADASWNESRSANGWEVTGPSAHSTASVSSKSASWRA